MSHVRDISAGNQPAAARRWRPAPAIRISAAIHVGGLAAVALDPSSWPYVGAALVANHAALGMAGIMPCSSMLGPNLARRGHGVENHSNSRPGAFAAYGARRGLDTVDGKPETVLSRLAGKLAGGDVLLLHDGGAYRRHGDAAVAVSVLSGLLERIVASGLKPVTLRAACRG